MSKDAVHRHASDHLPATLVRAVEAAEVSRADDLLSEASRLLADAREIHSTALDADDGSLALRAIREQSRLLDLLGRILGILSSGGGTTVQVAVQTTAQPEQVDPDEMRRLISIAEDWAERNSQDSAPMLPTQNSGNSGGER